MCVSVGSGEWEGWTRPGAADDVGGGRLEEVLQVMDHAAGGVACDSDIATRIWHRVDSEDTHKGTRHRFDHFTMKQTHSTRRTRARANAPVR